MGRGRAKAKQVKVARQLKYNGGGTDLDRLRAELGVDTGTRGADDSAYADFGDRYSGADDSDSSLNDDESDDEERDEDDLGEDDAEDLTRTSSPSA